MSIATTKIMNLADGKLLYDDLRRRVEDSAGTIVEELTNTVPVASFPDGADNSPVKTATFDIAPVQNLNGYDYPWVGGAGKNLFPDILVDTGTMLSRGITAVRNADYSITLTGTYNTNTNGVVGSVNTRAVVPAGTYIVTGTPADTFDTYGYRLLVEDRTGETTVLGYDTGEGFTFTVESESSICIRIHTNANIAKDTPLPTAGLTFYPMLRKSTDSATWEPYTNICPITGVTGANITRTGKNLFDISSYPLTNGRYINGVNGIEKETSGTNYDRTHDYIPFEGFDGMKITLNKRPSGTAPGIAFYSAASESAYVGGMRNAGATGGTPMTVEVPAGTKYMRFCVDAGATDVQIELGETATEYEPFAGRNTYNITFPVAAGTVYGGTLTVNQDGTGTLVVDRVNVVLDGTESFTLYSAGTSNARITMAKRADDSRFPNMLKPIDDAGRISSHYKMANITSSTVGYGLLMYYSGSNTYPSFVFRDPLIVAAEDSTTFATWVAGQYTAGTPVTLSYKLAESTSYTLTVPQVRTLLGQNYLWSDTGDVQSVKYPADTKMYIDSLTKTAENDMIADSNIPSGKFFTVGNSLYLSTSAIAQGAAIVPGTNCTAISLADALNTINA